MCPYARFQSAMFDDETLIIGYDKVRGEPRGKNKGTARDHLGDCVDCSLCYQVCPMGIDIRDGLQIECIACGLCVDACDNVMEKIGKPKGLVRYDTEKNIQLRANGQDLGLHLLRPRTIYYTVLLSTVCCLMLGALLLRSPLEMHVIHDRNPLFVMMSNGQIRNGYDIKILNKLYEDADYSLTVSGIDGVDIMVQSVDGSTVDHMKVKPDSVGQFRVFLLTDDIKEADNDIVFHIKNNTSAVVDDVPSIFITRMEQ
jgi:cytochrome c oxidase accessory protein FixG